MSEELFEAVVIGSGFGGAITACRLAKKWPQQVLVLERGKRYPMGSFPRSPDGLAKNFWNVPDEPRRRAKALRKHESTGMFDVRNYKHMDAVVCAGLGGGSLIYANVFLEPPHEVFDARWPESCKKPALDPYYRVAKEVLGARPVPSNGEARRRIIRTELFQDVAKRLGRDSELADINVFFGNDFDNPLPIGEQARNRYGALQTSCVYCGECDAGCNTHSKNTLDLNYLFVAEQRYGAQIRTEHLVDKIVPVDENRADDPGADGAHGYRVYYRDLASGPKAVTSVVARKVVVSAGSLGSTEILMRCKQVFGTLPRLSARLGQRFSANGDFLSFVVGSDKAADPNYGPVITQRTDFNLYRDFDRERAFVLEDAAYPTLIAWFLEGYKPGFMRLGALARTLRSIWQRILSGTGIGSMGFALARVLGGDLSYNTSVLLCMGLDRSNGTMSLDRNGRLKLDWPYKDSLPLYKAIVAAGKNFKKHTRAKTFFALPSWWWPFRNNVCVHALGGCVLADDPEHGVVSANPNTFGQAFGYQGLYVADGGILPSAVGANPVATISALAERVATGITGIEPDVDL